MEEGWGKFGEKDRGKQKETSKVKIRRKKNVKKKEIKKAKTGIKKKEI